MAYVIYTAPKGEERAKNRIEQLGFNAFVPLGRTRRQKEPKPYFPRYIFAWANEWGRIISSGWVVDVLRHGDTPAEINDEIVEDLKRRMESDGGSILIEEHDDSRQFHNNQAIRIVGGRHLGLDGIYQGRAGDRVIALLDIFQGQVKAMVPERYVA